MHWVQWARLAYDVALFALAVAGRLRSPRRPSAAGALALAFPTVALVTLFVLAGLSSPHAHRATHAEVVLVDGGCLAAAAVSWTGAYLALRVRSKYRVPLVLYGLAVGVFFVGEGIAVAVLNW